MQASLYRHGKVVIAPEQYREILIPYLEGKARAAEQTFGQEEKGTIGD
jgi:hypothetical protein